MRAGRAGEGSACVFGERHGACRQRMCLCAAGAEAAVGRCCVPCSHAVLWQTTQQVTVGTRAALCILL